MVYDAEKFLMGLFGSAADFSPVPNIHPGGLPPDWREAYEERAAIMEYDGGLPKERAEAAALADTLERMR